MDALDPADVVLQAVSVPPSSQPRYDVLEVLKVAAQAFREEGQFFNAGYAMEMGIHPAWGDRSAMERCVRGAFADYEMAAADAAIGSLDPIAALVRWSVLLGLSYLDGDRAAARRNQVALDHVLASRVIDLAEHHELVPDPCAILVRGFRLMTDFRTGWEPAFPPVEVSRGTTTSDGRSITLRVPSAFNILVGVGDYRKAREVADWCHRAFDSHGLRGWRAAVAGFTDVDHAVEHFREAADHFAEDVFTGDPGPEGWSSINVDLWAKYFVSRSLVAKVVASPEDARELVTAASASLSGTDSGWVNSQVTCFRVVLSVLERLFSDAPEEFPVAPREELLRAARFSGLDEGSAQALLFIDEIAAAFRQLQTDPPGALVSGTLNRALETLGRVPLFGPEVATALSPVVGVRAHESLLGQHLTWMHRELESIRAEADLRQVLLRLFQAQPPLYAQIRHGPVEYGKDIAVLAEQEDEFVLTMYAVKAGDVSKQNWPSAKQALEEIFQVGMSDVQLPADASRVEAVLAFNGHLNPYVEPVVDGWLEEQARDHGRSIRLMHLDVIVRWIIENQLISELRAALEETHRT